MNSKEMKFLAVLAVLAVSFTACAAVMIPADADMSDREQVGLVDNAQYSLEVTEGFTGTINFFTSKLALIPEKDIIGTGNTFVLSLVGITDNNTALDSDANHPTGVNNWGRTTGYGFFTINFTDFTGQNGNDTVWMYQKSTALSLADGDDAIDNKKTRPVAGTAYTERLSAWNYDDVFDGDDYEHDLGVLIPQDGSSIILEFYAADSSKVEYQGDITEDRKNLNKLTLIASFTIETKLLYTIVNLDTIGSDYPYESYTKANANYKDWTFDDETDNLTGTFGNNIVFKGNGIAAGTGINDATMERAGFKVKLEQNNKTSYFREFQLALDAVAADAAITLLSSCYSEETLSYSKAYALTVNLNGKELSILSDNDIAGKQREGLFEIMNAQKEIRITNGTIVIVPTEEPEEQKTLSIIENFNTNTVLNDVTIEAEGIRADPTIGWDTVIFNRNGTLTLSGNTKICGDAATYAIVSDSFKHTDEIAAYTGSLVKVGSGSVIVEGDMLVSYSASGDPWGVEELTGKGFDISAGRYSGILSKGRIAELETYKIEAYEAKYGNDMTFALSGGTFVEYSALPYVVEGKTITIDDGGKGVPAGPAKEAKITYGTVTIDTSKLDSGKANTLVMENETEVTKLEANLGNTEVVLIGKGQALSGVKVSVSGTGHVAFYGFSTVSGTVTTGTGTSAQTVKFSEAEGEFTVSQGSIVVNTDWKGGTIYLSNGDVLKLSGNIMENSYIDKDPVETSATFSAKVIIEAGASNSLTIEDGKTLEVKTDGIAVEIEGTVTGEGTLKVAKSITVKDGGVLSSRVASAETNIVYSGGGINHAAIDDFTKWTGKDAWEGYWTYKGKTLTLTNYNGTYNFAPIDGSIAGIEHIEVNGNNTVTLKEPTLRDIDTSDKVINALIGGYSLSSITTDGEGSLTFDVDISKVKGEYLNVHTAAIYGPVTIIDGVSITIKVSGSNSAWTDEEKQKMYVVGLECTSNLEHFNTITDVSVMPGYDSNKITGIFVAGNMNVIGKTLEVVAELGIQADNISVRSAVVAVKGSVLLYDNNYDALGDLTASSLSTFTVDGGIMAMNVTASQKSLIGIKEAAINGTLKNKGIVKITGNMMVGGKIENLAEMQNDGYIGIFGEFVNDETISLISGIFNNNGTLETIPMTQNEDDMKPVTEADLTISDTAASAGYAKVKNIHIYDVAMKYNGEFTVYANVTVYKSEGYAESTDVFKGTVMPGLNGYSLKMSSKTATITVDYNSTNTEGPTKVGKAYAISVSGSVRVGDDVLPLQANTVTSGSEATIIADTIKLGGLYKASNANIKFTGGIVYNYGTINISSATDAKIIGKDATLYGNISTSIEDVTFEGFFNGSLNASGDGLTTVHDVSGDVYAAGSVKVTGTMNGNIYAKKDMTVTGALTGDIETNGSVDIKRMTGSVKVVRATDDTEAKTLKVDGESSVTVIYRTAYKATKEATEPTQYMASMNIAGSPKGLVIDLAKGSDASSASEAVPGYFRLKATEAIGTDESVDIILTEGRILVDSTVTLESRYYLQVLAGTTIEVSKSGGTFDVRKGSLKVSKDAEALFETGSGTPVKYGKVLFIMSVEIEGGAYTVYSDVAYALKNCDEGAELDVGESAEIDQDVTVKKNVNIILEDVTLTFGGRNVDMQEGAKITIRGIGKVIFKESGDNHSTAKEGEDIVYYSVSGIIVYGDNTVKFDKVRFTKDSTMQGIAAKSDSAAKIKTDLELDEGAVYIDKGIGTGTITLKNDLNDVTKAENPARRMVFGSFIVSEGAVFDAVAINDTAATALYKAYTGEPKIDKYVMYPTIVGVEGTLNLTADTTVKGNYYGPGIVTLADGRTLTVDKAELPEPEAEKLIPGTLNLRIVDTADGANGYDFNNASSYTGTQSLVLTSGTFTVSGEKVNVMKVKGALYTGTAKATTIACLDGLRVFESAFIYGDTVYVIGESSTLDGGYVGAKLIYKHDKPFVDLIYDVVFEEDGYTIYAMFDSIDWDETTNVIIAEDVVIDTLDLSGRDVNIVVADGAELKVMKLLVIGSPATILGGEGSSIMGKVTIVEGFGAYIVAYADVDLSYAEIVTYTDVPAPKYSDPESSKLDVDNVQYATIFAAEADNLVLSKVDASLVPEIVGYIFASWLNYNGDAQAKVGETNAYAGMRATNVTITVKFAEGVSYYCNGMEFAVFDTPTKVGYNSVFTAKINDTSKYEGTPLINGKNSFIVTEDATLAVSGVTPIPEPPAPKPVIGDSGISLIDILLIVLVVLIAIMAVILFLRFRSV